MNTLVIDNNTGIYKNIQYNFIDKKVKNSESIILIDEKGILYRQLSHFLIKNNYKINILNFGDLEKTNSFNPLLLAFDYYEKDINVAYSILENMWKTILNNSDEEKIALSFSLVLFNLSDKKAINLYSIKEMLKSDSNYFYKLNSEYLKDLLLLNKDDIKKMLNNIVNKLDSYLKISLLSDVISYTNIDLDFSKKQVYFIIPSSNDKKLNRLLEMFLYQITYEYNFNNNKKKQLNIILDKVNLFKNNVFLDKLINDKKINIMLIYENIDKYKSLFPIDKINCLYNINNEDLIIKVEGKTKQKLSVSYFPLPNYNLKEEMPATKKEDKYIFDLVRYIEKNKNL